MDTTPVLDPPDVAAPTASSGRPVTGRTVLAAALVMVAVQWGIRCWMFLGRDYFADDMRMLDLAHEGTLFSPSYLLYDYDGHFMPGAFAVSWLVERTAGMEWWPAAVSLMVLQALASLALLRLLRVLLGDRPLLLVPLAVGLFTPMTLGFITWWASALNSLPLQIGLAWFLADAVRLGQTGRRRYAVSGTAALAVTLLFYLKAVLIPGIGFVVVALVLLRDGERSPVATAWRRARWLWAGSVAVLACWAAAYLSTRTDAPVRGNDLDEVVATITGGLKVLAPTVLGGPFRWDMFAQSTPTADVPTWSVVAGAVVLLVACVWTSARLRGAWAVWVLVLVTVAAGILMAGLGRSIAGFGAALPLTLRYFALEAVVLPVAVALLGSLPGRRDGRALTGHGLRPPWGTPLTALLTGLFVALSLSSTFDHARAWEDDRTADYLSTARTSLADAGPEPLLDQPLPPDVMWGLLHPYNNASRAFAPLDDRPEFASATTDLRMLDDDGNLRPAEVSTGAPLLAGPDADCGWSIDHGEGTATKLFGTVLVWEWTIELRVAADRAGELVVEMEDEGEPVRVPVSAGTQTIFIRVAGGGAVIRMTAATPGMGVCVTGGNLGNIDLQ